MAQLSQRKGRRAELEGVSELRRLGFLGPRRQAGAGPVIDCCQPGFFSRTAKSEGCGYCRWLQGGPGNFGRAAP